MKSKLTKDKEPLVLDNLSMVHYIVQKQMHVSHGHPSYEDYIQEGTIGLILAAIRFDESKGFKFSTYAFPMIYGCIQRYKRDCEYGIKSSRKVKDILFKVLSLQAKGLTLEDIEQTEGISGQDIRDALNVTHIESLDKTVEIKDGSVSIGDMIADPNSSCDIENTLSEEYILSTIQKVTDKLKLQWKKDVWEEYIYGMMYGEKFGQGYFAHKYNKTQSIVSRNLKECKEQFAKYLSE